MRKQSNCRNASAVKGVIEAILLSNARKRVFDAR